MLAARLGFAPSTVSDWIRDDYIPPKNVSDVCAIFRIRPSSLRTIDLDDFERAIESDFHPASPWDDLVESAEETDDVRVVPFQYRAARIERTGQPAAAEFVEGDAFSVEIKEFKRWHCVIVLRSNQGDQILCPSEFLPVIDIESDPFVIPPSRSGYIWRFDGSGSHILIAVLMRAGLSTSMFDELRAAPANVALDHLTSDLGMRDRGSYLVVRSSFLVAPRMIDTNSR